MLRKNIRKKFIPTDYGWISEKTPPQDNYNIVLLLYNNFEEIFMEFIGYYENNKWHCNEDEFSDCEVLGWIPLPYNPDNKI